MRFRIKAIAFLAIALFAGMAQAGTPYKVDAGHSHVGFAVHHFGVTPMVCSFTEVSGNIDYDAADPMKSSVEVTIMTGSLHSENPKRVDAVKSAFFLGVEEFPEITFKSKTMKKDGDNHVMVGDVTIRGVTKEVEFPFSLVGPRSDPFGGQRMGILAEFTVNRRDFNIMFDRKMEDGTPLVGDEVMVTLSIEASEMGE